MTHGSVTVTPGRVPHTRSSVTVTPGRVTHTRNSVTVTPGSVAVAPGAAAVTPGRVETTAGRVILTPFLTLDGDMIGRLLAPDRGRQSWPPEMYMNSDACTMLNLSFLQ